ncbi:MAG TPA: N-acetylglucosamine-6-phosphate deacetylase [Clostridiaceae bacterium]|nr:N-acetylglucosamine-6-phosphate deacetylase [Clostridiaceae bacterium]
MKTLIKNANVITPYEIQENSNVLIQDGKIEGIFSNTKAFDEKNINVIDAKGKFLAPGFIDVHNHGNNGHDAMEGTFEAIDSIARFHIKNGVTGFLATTMTASIPKTKAAASCASDYMEKYNDNYSYPKAQVLGIYFEGPYFSMEKKGAQPAEYIKNPTPEEIDELIEASKGNAKVIAIAPELNGAVESIRHIRSKGITVSAGHSNATYDETMLGIENGITEATHLYNGMRSFTHRDPGIVGAVLTDERVRCEMICDGIHLHKAAVKMAIKLKGKDGIILISDAMMAAGLKDGKYALGGQDVYVKGGAARLKDGTLAGSTLTLNRAVYNMVHLYGVPLKDAVRMASLNPAKNIGIDDQKGSIEIGKDADLILFDKDIQVSCAIVNGNILFNK